MQARPIITNQFSLRVLKNLFFPLKIQDSKIEFRAALFDSEDPNILRSGVRPFSAYYHCYLFLPSFSSINLHPFYMYV